MSQIIHLQPHCLRRCRGPESSPTHAPGRTRAETATPLYRTAIPPCRDARNATPSAILGITLAMTWLLGLFVGPGTLAADTLPPANTEPPVPWSTGFLSALVDEATTNNPSLRAAAHRQTEARLRVQGVRLWEDPMVRIGGGFASDAGPDLETEGDLVLEVQQRLPLFGKAQASRREADANAAVSEAESAFRLQILRRSIVQAAATLALADATLAIDRADLALVEQMTTFAKERQRAGLDSNLDLLRLQNEHDRRHQQWITDRLQRDFARVSLNRLLSRPQESSWPSLALPEIAPEIPLSDRLFSLGTRYEPRLQVMRREIAMAEAGIEVARRARRPDVSLGVESRQWSGSGGFREGLVTAGLTVPWFNGSRYRADIDRSRARADAVRADAEDYELGVRQELFRVWSRIDAARREALLYRDRIIPRSELAVSTALASWTAGRGSFLDLMDARRTLTEARLMHARAVNEQLQMITELVTCCGVSEIDSLNMLSSENSSAQPADPAPSVSDNP